MSKVHRQEWLQAARDYMKGLTLNSDLSLKPRQFRTLESFHLSLEQVMAASLEPRSAEQWNEFFTYRVPVLVPSGACAPHGQLDPKPFDLRPWIGLQNQTPDQLLHHSETHRVGILKRTCKLLSRTTQSDWVGIYQVLEGENGPELVKVAYEGRASRACFPLNESFANMSNNSRAALEQKGILVADVEAHAKAGKPYYQCDARVQSELCIPLINHGQTLGLIDLESFTPNHFTTERCLMAVLAGLHLVSFGEIPPLGESDLIN